MIARGSPRPLRVVRVTIYEIVSLLSTSDLKAPSLAGSKTHDQVHVTPWSSPTHGYRAEHPRSSDAVLLFVSFVAGRTAKSGAAGRSCCAWIGRTPRAASHLNLPTGSPPKPFTTRSGRSSRSRESPGPGPLAFEAPAIFTGDEPAGGICCRRRPHGLGERGGERARRRRHGCGVHPRIPEGGLTRSLRPKPANPARRPPTLQSYGARARLV